MVRGVWLDEQCFSLVKTDRMASHVILDAKTGKPPFYFQDVGKVCGRRFSWQFYCRTRKQSHIRKNTTRCKTFANHFRNKNELRKVEEIPALELNEYIWHLRVYHFAQNQRRERLWAFSALKSIGRFWTTSKKEQLLCQYHEWPCIWENKKSPCVQWVKTLLWYEYVVVYYWL